MIIGVSFEITQQKNGNILFEILKSIDIHKYFWYNILEQTEALANQQGEDFFYKRYYDRDDFFNYIQNHHYIIFLKLQAYFKNDKFYEIHTYDEFESSDCQLLVLINDCEFVEIYVKEATDSKIIFENALSKNYRNVAYITINSDKRTTMDLL